MKEIPLTQGYVALVDDDDYEVLMRYIWYAVKPTMSTSFYAMRWVRFPDGTRKGIYMHREVLSVPPGMQTDHRNRNGLDNRRGNLRACTRAQNNANRPKRPGCTSRFKGVSWDNHEGRWRATIKLNGPQVQLGQFDDERDAARAYNAAATKHFGEFALLNDIG